MAKIALYQPRVVCFVGKQIGQVFLKEASARLAPLPVPSDSARGSSSDKKGPTKAIVTEIASVEVVETPSGRTMKTTATRKAVGKSKAAAFEWGFQPFKVVHPASTHVKETLFFVMPSSSARVTGYQVRPPCIYQERTIDKTP